MPFPIGVPLEPSLHLNNDAPRMQVIIIIIIMSTVIIYYYLLYLIVVME